MTYYDLKGRPYTVIGINNGMTTVRNDINGESHRLVNWLFFMTYTTNPEIKP